MVQVRDDLELLDLMLEDAESAPGIYKPTNYWSVYHEQIIPELYVQGLRDFRKRRKTVLHKFNATDWPPSPVVDLQKTKLFNNKYTRRIELWQQLLQLLNATQISLRIRYVYYFARIKARKSGAEPLEAFEASLIGNPEYVVRLAGKAYTSRILQHYLDYIYCCNFVDFDSIKLLVELGSGSGKQIEVLKKLYPNICFLVFDIPPQLYVCEQYLAAVFPDSVVSYRVTRNMEYLPQNRDGKIFVFGNWRFPMIENLAIDLFWSCATFQEMEPDVVANYLKYMSNSCNAVYLSQEMGGKKIAREKGNRGVLRPTTFEDYKQGLPNFQLMDLSKKWSIEPSTIENSFWKRL